MLHHRHRSDSASASASRRRATASLGRPSSRSQPERQRLAQLAPLEPVRRDWQERPHQRSRASRADSQRRRWTARRARSPLALRPPPPPARSARPAPSPARTSRPPRLMPTAVTLQVREVVRRVQLQLAVLHRRAELQRLAERTRQPPRSRRREPRARREFSAARPQNSVSPAVRASSTAGEAPLRASSQLFSMSSSIAEVVEAPARDAPRRRCRSRCASDRLNSSRACAASSSWTVIASRLHESQSSAGSPHTLARSARTPPPRACAASGSPSRQCVCEISSRIAARSGSAFTSRASCSSAEQRRRACRAPTGHAACAPACASA